MTIDSPAIAANNARLRARPAYGPSIVTSDIGFAAGVALHQGACAVPITDPAMNAASVASMRVLPPPAVYKVPDAHPPPSCMPTPKRNAPTTTDTPTGEMDPRTACPPMCPAPSTGKNTRHVSASISICARIPAPRPSSRNSRHDDVNPNAA